MTTKQTEYNSRYMKKNKNYTLSAFCIKKYQQTARRCRASGSEFQLRASEMREVWETQRGLCRYTVREMEFLTLNDMLDPNPNLGCCVRLRQDEPWRKNNIMWVVWPVAIVLSQFTQEQFEEMCAEATKEHNLLARFQIS